MGLASYYQKYIRHYAAIVVPLTDMLKKDAFKWSDRATKAFLNLKQALAQAPVLALPDFSHPFVLEINASGTGIGAILSQQGYPIPYFSKKLSITTQRQSTYAREIQAIVAAVAKFCHYLLGYKFIIWIDHKSLKELQAQTIQTPEQQAWLTKLLSYDFSIEYKIGKENQRVDVLSRAFLTLTLVTSSWIHTLQQEFQT